MKKFLNLTMLFWGTISTLSIAQIRPTSIKCEVEPLYGYRSDGSPGRIISVTLKGSHLAGKLQIDVTSKEINEKILYTIKTTDSAKVEVLLPPEISTRDTSSIKLTIHCDNKKHEEQLVVNPMRHWTVYLYNHAHVDIGYTNTHKNVEELHKNNVLEGIKLGKETTGHTDGARFVWNPEVTWPVERLWYSQPDVRNEIIAAIKDGRLALDASYLNLNTSICLDEELFHVFKFSREMQKLSGQPMDVFQQFDIPGITWGLIPVMVQEGIKYIISWPNSDRAGNAHADIDGKPFWWLPLPIF